jgi:hypothetical protein
MATCFGSTDPFSGRRLISQTALLLAVLSFFASFAVKSQTLNARSCRWVFI